MMQLEKKAYTKGFIKEALTRNEYMRLVQNRQYIPPPQYIPLGRTGSEIRFGGPVTEINYGTPVTPYRNPGIAAPGAIARRGQVRWEDLPSTRMMMAASGYKMPALNPAKMNAATRAKWDAASTNAYNTVTQRAAARRTQTAETAAYDEILKRLNANPQRYGSDAKVNQERARRLAPLVARNYKRMPDGKWKSTVNDARIAKVKEFARNLGKVTAPKQQGTQQLAAVPAKPVVAPAKPVTPPVSKPVAQAPYVSKDSSQGLTKKSAAPTLDDYRRQVSSLNDTIREAVERLQGTSRDDAINIIRSKVGKYFPKNIKPNSTIEELLRESISNYMSDNIKRTYALSNKDIAKEFIKLKTLGLGSIAGIVGGKISQHFGGDRKRNAAAGALAGLIPGGILSAKMIPSSVEREGLKMIGHDILRRNLQFGLKARFGLRAAAPLLAATAAGALSGSAFSSKKKSVWEKLKEKFS